MPKLLRVENWQGDDTDATFNNDRVLFVIYFTVSFAYSFGSRPESIVNVKEFTKNMVEGRSSDFVELRLVATIGVFQIGAPS